MPPQNAHTSRRVEAYEPSVPPQIYLHSGQLVVAPSPTAITTILGSCVSVCLWDRKSKVGGINHYLLPYWAGPSQEALKYGNAAIHHLIEKMVSHGSATSHMQAKLFGGACVLASLSNHHRSLGQKNIDVAEALLSDLKIPIIAKDVGGFRARKIVFHTLDHEVWVKEI